MPKISLIVPRLRSRSSRYVWKRGSRLIAAATLADTNDFPTLGVAEATPSILQPRSRWSATSFERIRLKLRELALRLSKPCTNRRFASPRVQRNSSVCARAGKTGAILTCLTSPPKSDFASNELCCKPLLPREESAQTPAAPLRRRFEQWHQANQRNLELHRLFHDRRRPRRAGHGRIGARHG